VRVVALICAVKTAAARVLGFLRAGCCISRSRSYSLHIYCPGCKAATHNHQLPQGLVHLQPPAAGALGPVLTQCLTARHPLVRTPRPSRLHRDLPLRCAPVHPGRPTPRVPSLPLVGRAGEAWTRWARHLDSPVHQLPCIMLSCHEAVGVAWCF
jgi:hypothetical protein